MTELPKTPVYDRIGAGYDRTRRADSYIVERIAGHLPLQENGMYLDVACGTGNYTGALADLGGNWLGIDVSNRMLRRARSKARTVRLALAQGENLPFANGIFSGAVCTLALHHFDRLEPVFSEIHRALNRGRLVIFTSDPEQMRGYWLNEYFPQAMLRSIEQMPSIDRVKESLLEAGFTAIQTEAYAIRQDLQDLFLYSGKHRPYLYLDEGFRQNISTFSGLASTDEVREGCARLSQDIESGRISQVIDQYRNQRGDYLFVIADKGNI